MNEIPMSNTLCSRDQSAILQKLSVFVIHYGKYQSTHKKTIKTRLIHSIFQGTITINSYIFCEWLINIRGQYANEGKP